MKLIIQIPCYNEAETLRVALDHLPRHIDGVDEIDILITDVPYGELTEWGGQKEEAQTAQTGMEQDGLYRLIRNLTECLGEKTLFVIVTDKGQKLPTEGLKILEKGNVGKRRFYIFRKNAA